MKISAKVQIKNKKMKKAAGRRGNRETIGKVRSDKSKRQKQIWLNQRQKEILIDVAKFILSIAVAGTALAILLTAPGLTQALKPFIKNKRYKISEPDLEKIIEKIKKDRLVRIVSKDGKDFLQITRKGRRKFIEYNIDTIKIKKQKWDGKWRIVAFDIPEKCRVARDVLREKLREIGFLKLQKSLWVYPYECQDEISFITSVYEIERFVNYLEAVAIDNSQYLKNNFGLFNS